MRDQPDAQELLRLARAEVLDSLSPHLPDAERYIARLVANAIAIAARELSAGPSLAKTERTALAPLLGEPPASAEIQQGECSVESDEEAVERLSWRLAAEIRGGMRDGDAATYTALRQGVLARLREVNPNAADKAEKTDDSGG